MLGGLPGRRDESACYLPVHPVCVDVVADTAVDSGQRLRRSTCCSTGRTSASSSCASQTTEPAL